MGGRSGDGWAAYVALMDRWVEGRREEDIEGSGGLRQYGSGSGSSCVEVDGGASAFVTCVLSVVRLSVELGVVKGFVAFDGADVMIESAICEGLGVLNGSASFDVASDMIRVSVRREDVDLVLLRLTVSADVLFDS